jgi:hypothetical protein
MTQKIVINTRHGGFGLSDEAMSLYREFCIEGYLTPEDYDGDIPRDSPQLISVVTALGERASGPYARLKIVEVPDGVEWTICEYDGSEWVAEAHRTWS